MPSLSKLSAQPEVSSQEVNQTNQAELWSSWLDREQESLQIVKEDKLLSIEYHVRELVKRLYSKHTDPKFVNYMADILNKALTMNKNDYYAELMAKMDAEPDADKKIEIMSVENSIHFFIQKVLQNMSIEAAQLFIQVKDNEETLYKQNLKSTQLKAENEAIKQENESLLSKNEVVKQKFEQMNDLFDSFEEGCFRINDQGEINLLNSALFNILGYGKNNKNELNNVQLTDFLFDDKEYKKLTELFGDSVLLGAGLKVKPIAFKDINGDKKWLQFKLKKVGNESIVFFNDVTGFTEAINFPMKNPNIVCSFKTNGELKPVQLDGYEDDIFLGFRKILTNLGEKDPSSLFPENLATVLANVMANPGVVENLKFKYAKNPEQGDLWFSWKFRYDETENIIQAYAENVTAEEKAKAKSEAITINTLYQMAKMEEMMSEDTGPHIEVVDKITTLFVAELEKQGYKFRLDPEYTGHIATLHDLGKINIPTSIFDKPGQLNDEERKIMKHHANLGAWGIKKISDNHPMYEVGADIAQYHHEWWDGSGYPSQLKNKEIPVDARAVAIVDVFDALLSPRSYKDAKTLEETKQILLASKGTQFDPNLLDIFMDNIDAFYVERMKIIRAYELKQQNGLEYNAKVALMEIADFKKAEKEIRKRREQIEKRND